MAIKAVQIFLKHTEEYSDDTRNLIQQHGSPLNWSPEAASCTTWHSACPIPGI
jgi:hypothetical protein